MAMQRQTADPNPGLGYRPRSLADWFARQQSLSGQLSPYGAYGAMAATINKDITSVGNPMIGADFFTATYGAKVWDSLNSQTRAYNIFRKVPWGPTAGYRIRSGRNNSTTAVSELGSLPNIDKIALQAISIVPGFIVTAMGTSALAQFQGQLEGGIGDALAIEQEGTMIDHVKRINQNMLAANAQRVVSGANAGLNATMANNSWITAGDTFGKLGTSHGTINVQATALGATLGAGGTAQFSQNTSSGDILYALQRAGIWSIDDVVSQTGLSINGTAGSANEAAGYGSLDVTARTAANYWSAGLVYNGVANALRYLTTGMLDQAIDDVRVNGGEPDVMLTQIEQITRVATILQANQHFIGEGTFQVKEGGEGTLVGYPTGFQVSTYRGIPLFPDVDVARAVELPGNGSALAGGNVYVLDTRFIEIPVLYTTQYMESRDFLQNNFLGVKAIFLTALQLRCLDFVKQAKITDLAKTSLT